MKINIRTKNIDLTPSLETFVEEKIGSVEKFLEGLQEENLDIGRGRPPIEAFVEIGKTTRHHYKGPYFRAECNLEVQGKNIRAEAVGEDLRLAIVEVKDELQRQLKELKGKKIDLTRKKQRFLKKFLRVAKGAWFWKKRK